MPILIDKVRIHNFRSLSKCTVNLTPITLLMGANNSGKTSFLKALHIALGVGTKRISAEDFYISLHEEKVTDKEIFIDVHMIPVDDNYKRVDSFEDVWREKQLNVLINIDPEDKEYFSFRTKISYDLLKGDYVIKRYRIKDWKDDNNWEKQEYKEELKQYLDGFPLFFVDAQRDIIADLHDRTSYFGRMVSKIKIDESLIKKIEEQIRVINEGIVSNSAELKFLKTELERIQTTLSTGSTIDISPVNKKLRDLNRGININLQETSSESFPMDYHGMGTRSWASFLTFGAFIAWQYQNAGKEKEPFHALLALEEPEAHLHPHAQRTLYRQLSKMKGQKIISTHSPFIVSQANFDELRHFKKNGSKTEIKAIDLSELDADDKRKLRREVLHTRGELLFADAVVLFEGETEEQALPFFAEKCWDKHPYDIGISFVGVGGQNYKPFLKLIYEFELNSFILSDGEENTKIELKKSVKKIFGEQSENYISERIVFLPDNNNFEKYLIDAGYEKEIIAAISAIDGKEFVADYIRKHAGKSAGRKKTEEICNVCNQNIYEDLIRDYSGQKGTESAVLDIITNSKTRYASGIAESICKKEIPRLILDFLKKIAEASKQGGAS